MGQAEDLTARARKACADVLDRAADEVDPLPHGQPDFGYDAELQPVIPPEETVDEWRAERTPGPPSMRRRVGRVLRRAAQRLDGSVIDRRSLRY